MPRVAQGWGACDPDNPRNLRRRCSLLVEQGKGQHETQVLVDASPDLRWQLIDAGVLRLDGVVMTHGHADHLHGIDDLRPLVIQHRKRIDIYMDARTSAEAHQKFGYVFETPPGSSYPPILNDRRIKVGTVCEVRRP